jgi:hypothetical protein
MDAGARGTLRERLGSPLDLSVAISIIRQIAPVLDHLHRQGIVLRELNPNRIQITDEGRVILSGIEAARSEESDPDEPEVATSPETAAYISPEQALSRALDHRADLYSLGVILFEMLTGQVPFAPVAGRGGHALLQEPIPSPRERNADLPLAVEAVVLRALSKRPEERFQSAGELARALQAAAVPAPVTTNTKAVPVLTGGSHPPPLEPITRLQAPRDYTPFLIVGLIVLVCLGLMSGAIFLFANRGALTGAGRPAEGPTPFPSFAPLGTALPPAVGTQAAAAPPLTLGGTPVGRGQSLVRDSFSDARSGFGEATGAVFDRAYTNGEYAITIKQVGNPERGTAGWTLLEGRTFTNFIVEVECRMVERVATGACGLALRAQDDDNWYKFSVDPGRGQANAHLLVNNLQTKQLFPWQTVPAIKTGTQTNRLTVIMTGNRFGFLLNGAEVGSFTDDTFRQGRIGLIANAFTEPIQARFSNLVLTEIRQ